MTENACVNCGKTDEQTPLLNLTFKGEAKHICPKCFPILIHKPHVLAEKFPGFIPSAPAPHEH